MTAEVLSGVLAILWSLILNYIPGVNDWYAKQTSGIKSLIVLIGLFVISAVSIGIACAGLAGDFGISTTCDKSGIIEAGKVFVIALVASQGMYLISPQTKKVKAVKAARL